MKLRNLFKRGKKIHSDNTEIPIRHVEFNFDEAAMSKYCWDEDAFSSAFLLSFSAFIPHGERFVIDTIRACREDIKNPALKARVTGLIGQEAMHSKAHEEFNAVYQEKGIDLRRIDELGEWFFKRHLPAILPRSGQLAVTCAIEHFTALMAERSFSEQALMDKLDVGAKEFLTWHLVEEMEHKSVAFDVYQELVGSYLIRAVAMQLIPLYTSSIFAYSVLSILRTPGYRQSLSKMTDGFLFWFGLQGYFSKMQPGILRYFHVDYHPSQLETDSALHEWQDRLFSPGGMLEGIVIKTHSPKTLIPKNSST